MAHSLSAKKRIRQNEKRKEINRARKSRVRTEIKKFELAIRNHDLEAAKTLLVTVQKHIDNVASTNAMHKKTASRKKSRLMKKLNTLQVKDAS
ncbi:MAG: 30S ribosomal protein S20 [Phycisphaerae bacterium]